MRTRRFDAAQTLDHCRILDGYAETIQAGIRQEELLSSLEDKPANVGRFEIRWHNGGQKTYGAILPADEENLTSWQYLISEAIRVSTIQLLNSLNHQAWKPEEIEESWRYALFQARYKGHVALRNHMLVEHFIGEEFIQEQREKGLEL